MNTFERDKKNKSDSCGIWRKKGSDNLKKIEDKSNE